jgi:hypothetical protein
MPELNAVLQTFAKETGKLLADAGNATFVKSLNQFNRTVRSPLGGFQEEGAAEVVGWILRVPPELAESASERLFDFEKVGPKEAHYVIGDGLHVLTLGLLAVPFAKEQPPKQYADLLLYAAFGADAAAAAVRKPLLDRKFPGLPKPPVTPEDFGDKLGLDLGVIGKLLREGAIRELMRAFAECGYASQLDREWVSRVTPIGVVTGIDAAGRCAGNSVTVHYSNFSAAPPNDIADVIVSIPTRFGCEHVRLSTLIPGFPAAWSDAGKITFPLPAAVSTGCIGFFTLPPPIKGSGPCEVGRLSGAAGELQTIFAGQFGSYGVVYGQSIVNIATQAEAARHRPLPCASCQADQKNRLMAGPPEIDRFWIVETGPVYPRGTVTLEWSVYNADQVEIVALPIAGSENPHELPPIPGPLPAMDRRVISIPVTRRWEGRYEIRASNKNDCGSATASVSLRSGFSEYLLGCAKADITDRRPGLSMLGFAYKPQVTSGVPHQSIYARAFCIREHGPNASASLTIVVADIWSCTQIIRRTVIERLNARFRARIFNFDNLMIAGTHTHAAPGGYSEYFLYNLTIGGFVQGVFDTVVNGMVDAVANAWLTATPGRLFVNQGEVEDCGANRSLPAFQRNAEFPSLPFEQWTDREMLLLKFVADVNNRGETRPIGCLNWFGLHPTNLGMFNDRVSGDNKGWAEALFEQELASRPGGSGLIAAFANGSAGDVSCNVDMKSDGSSVARRPLGGPVGSRIFVPPWIPPANGWDLDRQRMEQFGERQFRRALEIFDGATEEVTGRLAGANVFLNMAAAPILSRPGVTTAAGALGVSFGAGSSEDSVAYASAGPADIDAAILEGITPGDYALGAAQFWATAVVTLGPAAPLVVGVLTGAVTMVPALIPPVLTALVGISLMPLARSYGAAQVAAMMFPGEVEPLAPQPAAGDDGQWAWKLTPLGNLDATFVANHGQKPIMMTPGLAQLTYTPGPANVRPAGDRACPLTPNVIPVHVLRIGQCALAAVPAEITTQAGRRVKTRLNAAFGGAVRYQAISSYSNGYSGYITTPEEYDAQHYEGASMLYGPQALEALAQTFEALASRIVTGSTTAIPGAAAAFVAPAIYRKP